MIQQDHLTAITSAIGEVLTYFGGLRMTRTTAYAAAGATSVSVESCYPMPLSGEIAIGNDFYTYSSQNGTALSGLAYTRGGVPFAGLISVCPEQTVVVDMSRTYSVLDAVKNTYFLQTATGEDLSVIGRNLGVPRLPQVTNDAQYLQLIKAIAYGPRGTTYGLHLALEALLGPTGFGIYTTPDKPATVTVVMPYDTAANNEVNFATYLDVVNQVTCSTNSLPQSSVPANARQIYNIRAAGGQTDLSVLTGTDASVGVGNAISLPNVTVGALDVGAVIEIRGGTASRSGGGNNNGKYVVASVQAASGTPTYIYNGTTSYGLNYIGNLSGTTGLTPGMQVTGDGIPAGTVIQSISGTNVFISNNVTGANNNARPFTFMSTSQTPAKVVVTQAAASGAVLATNGNLIAPSKVFTYPNDLGKTVTIASGPAAGTYTVAKIYEPVSGRDLGQYSTVLRTKSSSVQLTPAPAHADGAVSFVLQPSFVAEANLGYSLGGRCLQNGQLPAPIPLPAAGTYTVETTYVLAGALHVNDGVEFGLDDTSRPGYAIYMTDPSLNFAAYVNDLVPAGVVLQFDYT